MYSKKYSTLSYLNNFLRILVSLLSMGLAFPLVSEFSFIGKSILMFISNMSLGILYWAYARKNKYNETNYKTNNRECIF